MSSQRRSSPGAAGAGSLPLTTSEELDVLRPEWEALHASVRDATVFTHPAWLETWLQHCGGQAMPIFLSVRRDEELAGIIALDMDPANPGLLGEPGVSDLGPILAAPGEEYAVARGLLEWLNEDMAPAASTWGLPERSPLVMAIQELADDFGWNCHVDEEAVTPVRELASTFEDYLDTLSKKDRHELRRKLRQADDAGALAFEEYTTPDAIAPHIDQFLDFMRQSHAGKAAFLDDATAAFFRNALQVTAALGVTRLGVLTVDDAPIAMTWCFDNAEETLLYNSGYDAAHAAIAPGIVSKARALESAILRGKRRFNFLRGEEEYKFRMGGQRRILARLDLRHR